MKAVGIICEYNPFHNGHLHHINEIKKLYPNHHIVLVITGPFTERGDASILTKWDKTEIALFYGVDLVIELPFIFATGSADLFAKGAITILNELQVEYLVFGSEINNIQTLTKFAQIQQTEEFQNELKKLVKTGSNYPTALSNVLSSKMNFKIDTPNDLLGISYIKSILELNSKITPISIQRTNHYHDVTLHSNIASASGIRKAIKEKKNIAMYVPEKTNSSIISEIDIENFFPYLKYKIISELNHLDQYHEVSFKIIPRIQKQILNSNSLDELIHNIKSKNETYSKLKRMFLFILCGVTKEEAEFYKEHPYIRILGFTDNGKKYLKQYKKQITIPIISNYSNDKNNLLNLDLKVNQVYSLGLPLELRNSYLKDEISKKPIYYPKKS